MNSYNVYKKNEILYLEKEFKFNILNNLNLNGYIDFKRNIFANKLTNREIPITNKNNTKVLNIFNNNKFLYEYSYKRYDSYINYPNFSNEFYKLKKTKEYKSKNFFTNSGMSAITSLLLAINNILDDFSFIFPDVDIYFETYDFYNKYINKKNNNNNEIIYIDTISKKFDINKYQKIIDNSNNIFSVIIDTTCFVPEELKKLIENVLKKKKLCILVRSHTKLDMLGTEISSLGSLLYLIPNNISDDYFNIIKRIISESYYLLGKFGALCSPDNFPEFIFYEKFKIVNTERVKRIEKNNYLLYLYLNENINKGKIILPEHKKFVLYVINNCCFSEEQYKIIEAKIKTFVMNEDNIFHACSFGFDYTALDAYYDINEKNYVMRISMNDSFDNNNQYIKIKEFINDNF